MPGSYGVVFLEIRSLFAVVLIFAIIIRVILVFLDTIRNLSLSLYIYIYMYVCIYIYIYIHSLFGKSWIEAAGAVSPTQYNNNNNYFYNTY